VHTRIDRLIPLPENVLSLSVARIAASASAV
jgi:hypothetical protein